MCGRADSSPEGHRGVAGVVRPEGWVLGEVGSLGRGLGGAEGTMSGIESEGGPEFEGECCDEIRLSCGQ